MSGRRRRRVPGRPWPSDAPGREVRARSEVCPHDKICYPTRAAAHRDTQAIRRKDPTARLRPYLCESTGAWHIGVLPAAVIAGEIDADTYYAGTAPTPAAPKERT